MACGFLYIFFSNNCQRTGTKLAQRVCGILKSSLNILPKAICPSRGSDKTSRGPFQPPSFCNSVKDQVLVASIFKYGKKSTAEITTGLLSLKNQFSEATVKIIQLLMQKKCFQCYYNTALGAILFEVLTSSTPVFILFQKHCLKSY